MLVNVFILLLKVGPSTNITFRNLTSTVLVFVLEFPASSVTVYVNVYVLAILVSTVPSILTSKSSFAVHVSDILSYISSTNSSHCIIVTFWAIFISGATLSIPFTSKLTTVLFPALSVIVTVSSLLSSYIFVNFCPLLPSTSVHPSGQSTGSFVVNVTVTSLFVCLSLFDFSIVPSGATLSIPFTSKLTTVLFPALSTIVTVSSLLSSYIFVYFCPLLPSTSVHPSGQPTGSFIVNVTVTSLFVGLSLFDFSIVPSGATLSIPFTSKLTTVLFPTLSIIVTVSSLLSLYTFVNFCPLLSSTSVHPFGQSTGSFVVNVTVTSLFVGWSLFDFSILPSGATLSIPFTSKLTTVLFPALSVIVTVSSLLSSYIFVNFCPLLPSTSVHPSGQSTGSFVVNVAVTSLFVGLSLFDFSIVPSGAVVSATLTILVAVAVFPAASVYVYSSLYSPAFPMLTLFTSVSVLSASTKTIFVAFFIVKSPSTLSVPLAPLSSYVAVLFSSIVSSA